MKKIGLIIAIAFLCTSCFAGPKGKFSSFGSSKAACQVLHLKLASTCTTGLYCSLKTACIDTKDSKSCSLYGLWEPHSCH